MKSIHYCICSAFFASCFIFFGSFFDSLQCTGFILFVMILLSIADFKLILASSCGSRLLPILMGCVCLVSANFFVYVVIADFILIHRM